MRKLTNKLYKGISLVAAAAMLAGSMSSFAMAEEGRKTASESGERYDKVAIGLIPWQSPT